MKIVFAADHAGFEMKGALMDFVSELGHETEDCGAFEYNAEDDFPDFVNKAAAAIAESTADRAIILGGSGQGEAMAANRHVGVRAAVYYGGSDEIITLSRQHNDSNVLSIGARFVDIETAKKALSLWLSTDFLSQDKYQRRNEKLDGRAI